MTLALFNSIEDIEVLINCDNKPWFKRAHVGEIFRTWKTSEHLSRKGLDNR